MKRYIAHRGNIIGPRPELENKPEYIINALEYGFDCECDVWCVDNEWWLGHDEPQYKTSIGFLLQKGLWIHAKNIEALEQLEGTGINYFFHDKDAYVLTSKGYIWAYPGSQISELTVSVMPERTDVDDSKAMIVCSDYVMLKKLDEIGRNT